MTPYPSLAAMGPDAARSIGRHLDTTFRALARGEHAVDDPSFFRLLTGEPHPLGNMAILAPHATLAATRAAVAPLAAEPLRLAARLGYRVGILQSSEAGHRVYQALGFADLGGIPLFVRMPG